MALWSRKEDPAHRIVRSGSALWNQRGKSLSLWGVLRVPSLVAIKLSSQSLFVSLEDITHSETDTSAVPVLEPQKFNNFPSLCLFFLLSLVSTVIVVLFCVVLFCFGGEWDRVLFCGAGCPWTHYYSPAWYNSSSISDLSWACWLNPNVNPFMEWPSSLTLVFFLEHNFSSLKWRQAEKFLDLQVLLSFCYNSFKLAWSSHILL